MKIYRVLELPHGANLKTIGVYDGEGIVYIRKDLPFLIQIVALLHEVGHHIHSRIGRYLYRTMSPFFDDHALFIISSCRSKLWILFMERKDELICRKWMPHTSEDVRW